MDPLGVAREDDALDVAETRVEIGLAVRCGRRRSIMQLSGGKFASVWVTLRVTMCFRREMGTGLAKGIRYPLRRDDEHERGREGIPKPLGPTLHCLRCSRRFPFLLFFSLPPCIAQELEIHPKQSEPTSKGVPREPLMLPSIGPPSLAAGMLLDPETSPSGMRPECRRTR